MAHIILSPRLQQVANCVPPGSLFADIGTDHGNLPCYLLQQNSIPRAIASDLRPGPLNAARATAAQHQLSLDFRLGNGLLPIAPEEVTAVAIAGMGGLTIAQILEDWQGQWQAPWQGKLILQPMSTQPQLRHWLYHQDYTILQEHTVREGDLLYTIMEVQHQPSNSRNPKPPQPLGDKLSGRQWQGMEDPLRLALLTALLGKTEKALSSISTSQDISGPSPRHQELQTQHHILSQQRKEWISWNP